MIARFSRIFLFLMLMAGGVICASAQLPDASSRDGRGGRQEELPKGIRETLLKNRIEEEKKEYEEMIKRGEEAAKLSEELSKTFEETKSLSTDDQKKLVKLEKLVKKIRDDLGGEDDKEADPKNAPSSLMNALQSVHENAANLLSALKKTTRLTISAVAIESSNAVLKLVKFIRFYKN